MHDTVFMQSSVDWISAHYLFKLKLCNIAKNKIKESAFIVYWLKGSVSLGSIEELTEASKALNDALEFDLPKLKKQTSKAEAPKEKESCDKCGRCV